MYIPVMPDYLIMDCLKGGEPNAKYIPKRSQKIKNKQLRKRRGHK